MLRQYQLKHGVGYERNKKRYRWGGGGVEGRIEGITIKTALDDLLNNVGDLLYHVVLTNVMFDTLLCQ